VAIFAGSSQNHAPALPPSLRDLTPKSFLAVSSVLLAMPSWLRLLDQVVAPHWAGP